MPQTTLKACLYCKKSFKPKSHRQIYCSTICKKTHERETHKSIKTDSVFYCAWCGKAFESQHVKKYCSRTCLLYANGSRQPKRKNTTATELARVNQLARDAGLSYGKYVGREYAKLIAHKGEQNET